MSVGIRSGAFVGTDGLSNVIGGDTKRIVRGTVDGRFKSGHGVRRAREESDSLAFCVVSPAGELLDDPGVRLQRHENRNGSVIQNDSGATADFRVNW